jgi:hypothetical protein
LQEFSVQTSNYNSEFGQSAGAVVNIVIKSGGSKFHGDAFEFLRNGYFNAQPHFATTPDILHRHQFGGTIGGPVIIPFLSKGQSTQFFFGYQHTIYHQGSTASTTTAPTLAEEGRGTNTYADYGNYCTGGWNSSNLCNTASQRIVNPFTNVAYPLNQVPASAFDPASVNLAKSFPNYTGSEAAGKIGGTVNYYKPTVQFYDEYVARVDHAFGERDHLFGHYYSNYFAQAPIYDPAMLSSYTSYFNTRYQNALLAETHTFSNNLLNNLILNYQREVALRGGPPGSSDITAYGVNGLWQPTVGPYMAASVSGYFSVGSSAFAGWERNNYTFNDDLHWVKGNHNMAFGGHYELSKYDVTNVYQSYGGFTFGTTTAYPLGIANFMIGFMGGTNGFQQGNYEQVNDRNHFPGIYAQDSWKINHRLTVNYGVRWEDFAPWAEKNSAEQEFIPANYVALKSTPQFSTLPAGMMLDGDPGIPKYGLNNNYKQFMPRVGFAYDVWGTGKLVVRGGGGIFYQDRMPGFFNLSQASFVPNTVFVGLTNPAMYAATPGTNTGGPFSDPYCATTAFCSAGKVTNPFPFTLPFASNHVFPNGVTLVEYDPSGNFKVPVTYDYNLTIEHQLASSLAMRLAYVGSGSRHQFVNLEINPTVNTGSFTGTNGAWVASSVPANGRRPYNTAPTVGPCTTTTGCAQNYAQMVEAAMIGSARFNSLQVSLEKKMSHGVSMLANYTWSKTYDDMPQATRVGNTQDLNAGESYVYPLYPAGAVNMPAGSSVTDIKALDRGLSDIDKPHAISVSYVYQLPRLRNGNSILKYAANGWRTSGLIQHHSGDALTTYVGGTDTSLTGLGQERAVRDFTKPAYYSQGGTGDCAAGKKCVNWLNAAAFTLPVNTGPGTGFGNVVKGSLRGPGYTNWDTAVIRSFPVYREMNLDFRAEFFDVLNHTELSNPGVSNPISSSTSYGTITGTQGGPRIMQFSMKFTF